MDFFNSKATMKDLSQAEENLQRQILTLNLEVEKIKTHIVSLRGLFNRKLGDFEKPEQTETIKSPDGLDMLRRANKDARSN